MNAIVSLFFLWIDVCRGRGTAFSHVGRLAAGLALLAGLAASPMARAEIFAYNDTPNSTLFVEVCLDYYSAQYGNVTSQFSSSVGTASADYGDYIWITDEEYYDWTTETVESYSYYSCGSHHEYHETWESFDEWVSSGSSDWSPGCSGVWEDESFTQTREQWEWHRTGERSNFGEERNVSWDRHTWDESQSAQGCRSLNWQSFNDVVADWHEVSNGANCSSVWEDQSYSYNYTEERIRRVGWRNDRDGVTNSEDVTDSRSGSRSESGCKPLNWRSFEETTQGWHAVTDWNPSPGGTWEDQSCSQSRTLSRTRRTGERNDRGDERNVSSQTDTDTENRSVPGTRPLNWRSFEEVLSGWQEVARSPSPSGVWEDTQFTQTATDERSVRTGEQSDRGDTRNVQTSTGSRQRNIEGVWGTRPLNWHFWENRLTRDWYDLGAWAPALNTRFFWEDVAQSLGQLQDWAEWQINDRGNSRLVRVFVVARTLSRTIKGTKIPTVTAFELNLPLGGGSVRVGAGGGSVTLPNGTVITGSVGGTGGVSIPGSVIPGGVSVNTSGGTITVTTAGGTSTVGAGGSANVGGGIVVSATGAGNATVTLPGGTSIAVGPGGGSIAFPGGTSVRVSSSGRIDIDLPPGAPSILAKAVDLAGAIYNTAAGHIISVRNVIGLIVGPLPPNPLLDAIDIGVALGGAVQLGLRQGNDGPYAWLPVHVNRVPVEAVSRDKFLAGSITVPQGMDGLEMEFVNTTSGESLGRYGSLLGNGGTKIYNTVPDILSDADVNAGGQSENQKVWLVKDGANARKVSFYTLFTSVGNVEIRLWHQGQLVGLKPHLLVAAQDFADWIAYVENWINGVGFDFPGAPPSQEVPPMAFGYTNQSSGPGSGGNRNLTRACLIPIFNIIAQVEGIEALARGLFDGAKAGLKDDWATAKLIRDGYLFSNDWAANRLANEIIDWRDNPVRRARELMVLSTRICHDLVFTPLAAVHQDFSSWEGFRQRAWSTWDTIKHGAEKAWTVTRSLSQTLSSGFVSWMDDFSARMMAGSERTAFSSAPWHTDELASELIGVGRTMAYSAGYYTGYLGEQVAMGVVTGGALKIGQVLIKGGTPLVGALAKQTAFAVTARLAVLKRSLRSAGLAVELRLAIERGLDKAARQKIEDAVNVHTSVAEFVESRLVASGANRNIANLQKVIAQAVTMPKTRRLFETPGMEGVFLDRFALFLHIMGDAADDKLILGFLKTFEQRLVRVDGDQVSEWSTDFLRCFKGNPSEFVNRGPFESFSPAQIERLRKLCDDPDPGWVWKLDDEPPQGLFLRGIIAEIDLLHHEYRAFTHLPTAEVVDFVLAPKAVQLKTINTASTATINRLKGVMNDLSQYANANCPERILDVRKKPGVDTTALQNELQTFGQTLNPRVTVTIKEYNLLPPGQ